MCWLRYFSLQKKNIYSVFNIFSLYYKDLSFTLIKHVCRSQDRDCIDISSDLSVSKNREDQWNHKETEADNKRDEKKEIKNISERNKSHISSLYFTKKRSLSFTKKKSCVKHYYIKCHHFFSSLSSDEKTALRDELNISSYRSHHISDSQLISSHSTDLERDISEDDIREFLDSQSDQHSQAQIVIIYKQQSWEEEIINEKNKK